MNDRWEERRRQHEFQMAHDFVWTGEVRPPREGDWFIVGDRIYRCEGGVRQHCLILRPIERQQGG